MARPQKEGIDYFSLDTEMDDKVKLIDAKYGVAGFGVLVKVWQIIYDSSYYIKWTEKETLLYKNRINADINFINNVINECLKWEIFNNQLYETYSILTSTGIQKRYFEAVKRRTEITLTTEFVLAPFPDNFKPAIKVLSIEHVCKNLKNADINLKNADRSTQSKVNKSKVNKNKEDPLQGAGTAPYCTPIITLILNDKSDFQIHQDKVDNWHELYPSVDIIQELRKMKGWLEANPTKRKTKSGILRFVTNWLAKEQDKGGKVVSYQTANNRSNRDFDQRASVNLAEENFFNNMSKG